ncbi:MAG: hypothetical protein AB1630_12355 [bacterium]
MGVGIAWIPFFLFAHIISLISNILLGFLLKIKEFFPLDGYSYLYIAIISLGSCFYGLLALFLSFRVSKRFFSTEDSFLALLNIFLASPFVFVFYWMPTYAHLVDSFAIALFLLMWIEKEKKKGKLWWFLWGLSFGFVCLVRWQNIVFSILLFAPPRFHKLFINHLFFLIGAFLPFFHN